MTFIFLIRRVHLILGLLLLPWFVMYGIGALPFSHGPFFEKWYRDGTPEWTTRIDRPYSISFPEDADFRQIGSKILRDMNLEGAFGTYRPDKNRLIIYLFNFWSSTQLTYFVDEQRLLAEDARFRWDHFLGGMHGRGGFEQSSFLDNAWAVVVDLVCVGILLWIATGIIMWWQIPQTRFWGALALGCGVIGFLIFLVGL